MEFREVVRRRRMVRSYDGRPLPHEVLERIVEAGLRAPSAGFAQGTSLVVLAGASETGPFWNLISRHGLPPEPGGRWDSMRSAAAVILPLAHKQAYVERYAEPDKVHLGLTAAGRWPMPFWDVDAAFTAMSILLAATDEGVGALFFAIAQGVDEALASLGVPPGHRPIGAISLGYPAAGERPSPSLARGHKAANERVHWGRWRASPPGAER